MLRRLFLLAISLGILGLAVIVAQEKKQSAPEPKIPEMKFNDVVEIAPGVFFRYSSISATDPKVPFGGSNNIWIVFKDYVVVVDANFPKEASDVIADIRKTTKKPIKYVLDTHHHGDHAYGNCIWAKEGARIVASTPTSRLLKTNGPKQWEEASKDRKDIKENELKQADVTFDEKFVVDDGTQRVEFIHLGHCHTAGDAAAYLPKHKILCMGDACVNGSFNFMGHSNSASWIANLGKMQKLDIDLVCPGHGKVAGKELLGKQKRYFEDMRKEVQKGIDDKKSLEDITKDLAMDWYKEWTGKAAKENKDNVKHVFDELNGKVNHDRLGQNREPLTWPGAIDPVQYASRPLEITGGR
jgi:glyoxylase-like metal-dependent hydrolase (beta-lactamase superfamily II)